MPCYRLVTWRGGAALGHAVPRGAVCCAAAAHRRHTVIKLAFVYNYLGRRSTAARLASLRAVTWARGRRVTGQRCPPVPPSTGQRCPPAPPSSQRCPPSPVRTPALARSLISPVSCSRDAQEFVSVLPRLGASFPVPSIWRLWSRFRHLSSSFFPCVFDPFQKQFRMYMESKQGRPSLHY